MKNKIYVVHEVRGGLMEDPDFHYHNPEKIIAGSKEEATAIYDRRHSLYYFTGSVKSTLEETDKAKTSDEPLNQEDHQHRINFYHKDKKWSKYVVTLEFKVKSVDLLDVEVEAEDRDDAIRRAKEKYINNPDESSMRASDYYESKLDTFNYDFEVEEIK